MFALALSVCAALLIGDAGKYSTYTYIRRTGPNGVKRTRSYAFVQFTQPAKTFPTTSTWAC